MLEGRSRLREHHASSQSLQLLFPSGLLCSQPPCPPLFGPPPASTWWSQLLDHKVCSKGDRKPCPLHSKMRIFSPL